jgi:uncharacterized protein (DUF2267 family)
VRIFERFLTLVEHATDLDRDDAVKVASAVLETLFERLSGGEAADMAERLQLPRGFVSETLLLPERPPDAFDRQEFLRRVGDRAGVDAGTAERYSVAVVAAVRPLTGGEFGDMLRQLPREFAALIDEAARPKVEITSADDFVESVATETGLRPDRAREAVGAVLETLAERLAEQEVDELVADLGDELAEPLRRGNAHRPGAIRGMSPEQFVRLVAEREHADGNQAGRDTRAVLGTLADAVPDEHFADVLARLPDDYADLVRPR